MKKWLRVCIGEIKKQKQNYYSSIELYLSMLLWPILSGISTYFIYKSFDLTFLSEYGINNEAQLLTFVFTGALGYNCFFAMVQGALFMRNERENGTLEMVFLTPANRMAMVYGRSLGGFIQNAGMFAVFTAIILIISNGFNKTTIINIPIAFLIVLISSVIWGGLINAIFIISRDIDFWFIVCDEPMRIFSGTEIPIMAFPKLFKLFSAVFPLTHCLILVRQLFSYSQISWLDLIINIIILSVIVIITRIIISYAENSNRKTGNLQLY